MIVDNKLQPQKGIFSKFANVLQRNDWFTNPMMATLLSWMTSQIQ